VARELSSEAWRSAARWAKRAILARISWAEQVWKTERDERSSWSTPRVVITAAGAELVTNASNYIRGYDPRTGQERWRLRGGGGSIIPVPTPTRGDDFIIIASSGVAGRRPLFVLRPGGRGYLSLKENETSNASVAWSRPTRGSFLPTPLAYRGLLYVLANNGVLDAYDLKTGDEIYRQRLPEIGSGFSASPWRPTARSTSQTRTARWSSSLPGASSAILPRTRWASC
jgi:outer membrane protein assembly factor BamB